MPGIMTLTLLTVDNMGTLATPLQPTHLKLDTLPTHLQDTHLLDTPLPDILLQDILLLVILLLDILPLATHLLVTLPLVTLLRDTHHNKDILLNQAIPHSPDTLDILLSIKN